MACEARMHCCAQCRRCAFSPCQQEKVDAWEEERRVSKYADALEQLPATKRIPTDPKQVRLGRLV